MNESLAMPFRSGDKKYGTGQGFSPFTSRAVISTLGNMSRLSGLLLSLFLLQEKYFLKSFGLILRLFIR
jgi:hypothetical protein